MRHLLEYIVESSSIQTPGENTRIKIFIDVFGTEALSKCGNKHLKGSNKHKYELMRCYLGEDDDVAIENVKLLLNKGFGINVSDDNIEYGNFTEASGLYPAALIKFNEPINVENLKYPANTPLYIINTCGKVKKKELTPSNLGIAGIDFHSVDEIKDKLESSLNGHQYKHILDNLIENIIDNIKDKNSKTLQELIDNPTTVNITNINNEIDDKSIRNIFNDFGEILSGIFMLQSIKNADNTKLKPILKYPIESNFRNVDFFINFKSVVVNTEEDKITQKINTSSQTINVSAKSGHGAACSCVSYADGYKMKIDSSKYSDEFNKIIDCFANKETGKAKSAIITTDVKLIKLLKDKDDVIQKGVDLLSQYNLISLNDNCINVDEVNKLYKSDKEKLHSIIKEYYDILNYKSSVEYNIGKDVEHSTLFKKWDSNDKIAEGAIIYPLRTLLIKYINSNYSKELSESASYVTEYIQIYITYKTDKCVFKIENMSNPGTWQLETSGSVSNPRIKSTGLRKKV